MDDLRKDIAWSLQTMKRHPGITAIVVLSLGLSIGVNTAVFSLVNAFLLRPLPIHELDRVVRLRENTAPPGKAVDSRNVWDATYFLWKQYSTFSAMGAAAEDSVNLTGAGEPQRLAATGVTASFFDLLGIKPMLGRNISADEDRPGAARVVILGNGLWASHFGSDPRVLGRSVMIDGRPATVIGVMPPSFRYPYNADVWVPLAAVNNPSAPPDWRLYVIARLAPGATVERAAGDMNALVQRLGKERPLAGAPLSALVTPLRQELIHDLGHLFFLLSAAAGFVLLIACANVSNLLLAQSVTRGGEVAVRVALGATRGRLIRQFLTYSLVLALLGGALGVLLTFWSVQPLVALSPLDSIRDFDAQPRIDPTTLAFTLGVSLAVGILFGTFPALRATRFQLNDLLKEGGRSRTLGAAGRRILSSFVVTEVALALVLLVGAGLMLRSYQRLQHADRGFRLANVLTAKVAFAESRYPDWRPKYLFIHSVIERLAALPGVTAAAGTTTQPLEPGQQYAAFNVEGNPALDSSGYHLAHSRNITPDYFTAMKIPLLAGRTFTEHDDDHSQNVVIVSKSFADRYWPGQSAVGRRVKRGTYTSQRPWMNVVGVVGTLAESADAEQSIVDAWYLPYSQTTMPYDGITFVVKSAGQPEGLIVPLRRAVEAVDKDQPVYDVATLEQRLANRTVQERFTTLLYAILGGLGLLLSTLGIYGVISFSVGQREREIGIRAALGAAPRVIRAMVLRSALLLTAAGLAIGSLVALILTRFLAKLLYEVSPRDPATLLGALVILAFIAVVSSYLPARRAARFGPQRALKHE